MSEQKQKKSYTPPTLTQYGKVEQETKGSGGDYWEVYGARTAQDDPA